MSAAALLCSTHRPSLASHSTCCISDQGLAQTKDLVWKVLAQMKELKTHATTHWTKATVLGVQLVQTPVSCQRCKVSLQSDHFLDEATLFYISLGQLNLLHKVPAPMVQNNMGAAPITAQGIVLQECSYKLGKLGKEAPWWHQGVKKGF